MSRISLDPARVPAASRAVLAEVQGALGATPALFKAVANSPAALNSLWGSFGALRAGTLGTKLGEQLAVAIANRNGCEYCLAAHTALGRNAGVSIAELAAAQRGQSADARTAAALAFALKVVEARGRVTAADVAALRSAGFDDGQVVEILAHVALNVFTNYVNIALDVPVDFPRVALSA